MDPKPLVAAFNSLPRNSLSPSGLVPNHWHFSLRYVPLPPPGTVLFILNPHAEYVHVEGPLQGPIENESIELKATLIAVMLLRSFASEPLGKIRPWSWSTNDAVMAGAIGETLKGWGIKDGLDVIGVAEEGERNLADEKWGEFFQKLDSIRPK